MDNNRTVYKKAFETYIRRGTPIDLSLKQAARPTDSYVWITRLDDKVRDSHAANHGGIFNWNSPPLTGHPGDAPGCRCVAVPYRADQSEDFSIQLQDVADTADTWNDFRFISHYFLSGGAAVILRETGNLEAVVERYRQLVLDNPGILPGQISDAARTSPSFRAEFGRPYNMTDVVFSLGNTTIGGIYSGGSQAINGMLYLAGNIDFYLKDSFREPLNIGSFLEEPYATPSRSIAAFERQLLDYLRSLLRQRALSQRMARSLQTKQDLRELPGGTPYAITDAWNGTFWGRVFVDAAGSQYVGQDQSAAAGS